MRLKRAKKGLKAGSVLLAKKFAWLPTTINDAIVWMEFYEELMLCESKVYNVSIGGKTATFNVIQLISLSKRFIR